MPCTKPDVRHDSPTCSSALSRFDECFVTAYVSYCDVRDARAVTYAGKFAVVLASSTVPPCFLSITIFVSQRAEFSVAVGNLCY